MLIEGIDDSIVFIYALIFLFIFYKLFESLRNSPLTQRNAQVHPDALNDVAATRTLIQQQTEDQQQHVERRRYHNRNDIQCPICLTDADLPIETNCGHLFCGNCIVQHWRVKTHNICLTSISCPICRQAVTMLLPLFPLNAATVNNEAHRPTILSINKYNKRFSGAPRSYMDYLYDLPTLLRHAFNAIFELNGLQMWYRIRVVFFVLIAIAYLLSPLDIIPESLFGIIGFIDDIFVLFFLAIYISIMYRQVVADRTT